MKKGGGSESTIIIGPSKSVLVYALHTLEYVLGLARFRVFVPKIIKKILSMVTVGRRNEKRWVALLTCLSVLAIHIELAHDLSTDAFIIAFKNFINRRGVPHRIHSDNGKNFVGANEEVKRFNEVFEVERIQNELSGKGIEWIFNYPSNPSEGGV